MKKHLLVKAFPVFASLFVLLICSCATSGAITAEEYYSIGMAYFDLGNYAEAERWLNRASAADRTMVASDYNLGRIAFETGRYDDAAMQFEKVLARDPVNVMALRAAAYSRIMSGDFEQAEALYDRVLALVPESADDGFNYALVLYALTKYGDCEAVLFKYPFALEENANSVLLLARAQKAQGKVEAVDSYAKWLSLHTGAADAQGLYEYAQVLETAGLFARALEQYADAINSARGELRATVMFAEARLLLIADPGNAEGMQKLVASVTEGFSDAAALEELLADVRVSQSAKDEIRGILNNLRMASSAGDQEPEVVSAE